MTNQEQPHLPYTPAYTPVIDNEEFDQLSKEIDELRALGFDEKSILKIRAARILYNPITEEQAKSISDKTVLLTKKDLREDSTLWSDEEIEQIFRGKPFVLPGYLARAIRTI